MPLFTPEVGRELAEKRWSVCPTHSKPKPAIIPDETQENPIQAEIARTREQILKLNDLIDECTDAKEQDALTRAKDRQFRIWARLAQLPTDPKPAQARTRSAPMPTPQPVVVQPVNTGQSGASGSGAT